MKRASLILLLSASLVLSLWISQKPVSAEKGNNVLLILRERTRSADKQHMISNEAIMMKSMLEEAGFKVVIASASGRTFILRLGGNITLESDVTLADVNIADYAGFIIPCMASEGATIKPEEVAIVRHIVAAGKPVAAQQMGVVLLAEAGVLAGKRYSWAINPFFDTRFKEGIYGGNGVVQDGKIITSAYCPAEGSDLDQTVELTQALIAELQK